MSSPIFFEQIPVQLDLELLMRRAGVDPASDDAEDFAAIVERAQDLARPKALYCESFIESRTGPGVTIGGVTFTSRNLGMHLADAQRIFPHVATCGHELDLILIAHGDMLATYWLDVVKTAILGIAHKHLIENLTHNHGLDETASVKSRSGDATVWSIEQRPLLFKLLGDAPARIGVRLTANFAMTPHKTISGFGLATGTGFRVCQLCHSDPGSAPFDREQLESLQIA